MTVKIKQILMDTKTCEKIFPMKCSVCKHTWEATELHRMKSWICPKASEYSPKPRKPRLKLVTGAKEK